MRVGVYVTLLALHVLVACGVRGQLYNDTLEAVLDKSDNVTTFQGFVDDLGLNTTLRDPYVTLAVFAPTDEAFSQLPENVQEELKNDPALLAKVATFHFFTQAVTLTQNNAVYPTLAGLQARVNTYPSVKLTTLSGVPVDTSKSMPAHNGALYLVDRVLYPLPVASALDALQGDEFSNFRQAVSKAVLEAQLNAPDITILAPADSAFYKLEPRILSLLFQDVPLLTRVLQNHIVQGVWYSAYFKAAFSDTVTTAINQKLLFRALGDGSLEVGKAKVTRADVSIPNGVVYYIDTLLMPEPGLLDVLQHKVTIA